MSSINSLRTISDDQINGLAIGGFYCWDSIHIELVATESTSDYGKIPLMLIKDSETEASILVITPNELLRKLTEKMDEFKALDAQSVEPDHLSGHTEPEETCALCAHEPVGANPVTELISPVPTVAEEEPEGTLLSNEVIAELIQMMGKMRTRIEQLEAGQKESMTADQVELLVTERVAAAVEQLDKAIENEVEKQVDRYDFKPTIKDALDDIDLTEGGQFKDSVMEIVRNEIDADDINNLEDLIKSTVVEMDLEDKVLESIDDCGIKLLVEGTDSEGRLMVRVSCS
jgi:hypothetical protein